MDPAVNIADPADPATTGPTVGSLPNVGVLAASAASRGIGRAVVGIILQARHSAAYFVSGLAYDMDTGLIEVVVPPTPLSLA